MVEVFIAQPPGRLDLFLQPWLINWNVQRSSTSDTLYIRSFEQQLDNTTIFATNVTDIDMFDPNLWHYMKKVKEKHCPRNLTLPDNLYSGYDKIEEANKVWYYYLFLALFDFSPSVQNRTHVIREHFGMDENDEKPYIAVHVQTGDAHFGSTKPSDMRHNGEDIVPRFYDCSRKLQFK
jgi:hypothetical protein